MKTHRIHVQQSSESMAGPRGVWLDGRPVRVRRVKWDMKAWDPAVVTLEMYVAPGGLTISSDPPEEEQADG